MIETETRQAPTVLIDWNKIDNACAARGATTETAQAKLLGVARYSLHRWRRQEMDITVSKLAEIAARVGLTLQEVALSAIAPPDAPPIPGPPPQPPRPAGPDTPPPPPGPKP